MKFISMTLTSILFTTTSVLAAGGGVIGSDSVQQVARARSIFDTCGTATSDDGRTCKAELRDVKAAYPYQARCEVRLPEATGLDAVQIKEGYRQFNAFGDIYYGSDAVLIENGVAKKLGYQLFANVDTSSKPQVLNPSALDQFVKEQFYSYLENEAPYFLFRKGVGMSSVDFKRTIVRAAPSQSKTVGFKGRTMRVDVSQVKITGFRWLMDEDFKREFPELRALQEQRSEHCSFSDGDKAKCEAAKRGLREKTPANVYAAEMLRGKNFVFDDLKIEHIYQAEEQLNCADLADEAQLRALVDK
ncbi:MAG: hypothetical protein EOP06_12935 [Proteobacteria bacterium]|nr:MAG: hypothetical protein EOP06_12935 [Pseudomonadota bacterium]